MQSIQTGRACGSRNMPSKFCEEEHSQNKVNYRKDHIVDHGFNLVGRIRPGAFDCTSDISCSCRKCSCTEQSCQQENHDEPTENLLVLCHTKPPFFSWKKKGRGELLPRTNIYPEQAARHSPTACLFSDFVAANTYIVSAGSLCSCVSWNCARIISSNASLASLQKTEYIGNPFSAVYSYGSGSRPCFHEKVFFCLHKLLDRPLPCFASICQDRLDMMFIFCGEKC